MFSSKNRKPTKPLKATTAESLLAEARRAWEEAGSPKLSPWWRDPIKLIAVAVGYARKDPKLRPVLIEELTLIEQDFRLELLKALDAVENVKRGRPSKRGVKFDNHIESLVRGLTTGSHALTQDAAFHQIAEHDPFVAERKLAGDKITIDVVRKISEKQRNKIGKTARKVKRKPRK